MKEVSIAEAKETIKEIFDNPTTTLTPLLCGGAGVGKTSVMRQVCKELELTGSYVNMADMQPGEFVVNFVNSKDKLGTAIDPVFHNDVVLFDELNRAELVMAEVMNIMQSKTIRGLQLDCKFIGAMNLGSSYTVSDFDPAQWGRFVPMIVKPTVEEWARFMTEKHKNLDPNILTNVLSFVRQNGVLQTEDDMVTPRVWDELLILGVDKYRSYLLPNELSHDLKLWCERAQFPSYKDANKDNWVPVWAEYDYVLGGIHEPIDVISKLLMCLSIDSLGLVLTEISTRNGSLHRKIMKDQAFVKYIEEVL